MPPALVEAENMAALQQMAINGIKQVGIQAAATQQLPGPKSLAVLLRVYCKRHVLWQQCWCGCGLAHAESAIGSPGITSPRTG